MPARKAQAAKLPDAEIQALADHAALTWEAGEARTFFASNGDRYEFQPIRDDHARLLIQRFKPGGIGEDGLAEPETLLGSAVIGAAEFGVENPGPMIASRVLAAASA